MQWYLSHYIIIVKANYCLYSSYFASDLSGLFTTHYKCVSLTTISLTTHIHPCPGTTILLCFLQVRLFWTPHISDIRQCLSSSVWLTSLSRMCSWSTHVADGRVSSIVFTQHLCIHSPIDEHLSCLHILAVVTNAAVNMGVQKPLWEPVFISIGCKLGNVLVGWHDSSIFQYLRCCFSLWGGYTQLTFSPVRHKNSYPILQRKLWLPEALKFSLI